MDNNAFNLRNYWDIGAYIEEVEREPLARRLLDQPIIMYRLQDGTVAAIEDRCTHRPLLPSGKIIGDHIQCGYHGLEADGQGRCVKIPDQNAIPSNSLVRSYVTHERDGFVWLWMGDEDGKQKLDEVPDLSRFCGLILLHSRTQSTGNTDPQQARNLHINALTTPESIRSLWLYVQIHRDFETDNQQVDDYLNSSLLEALDEDRAMIEQQQLDWDEDGPDAPMINLKTDGASVAMRKVLGRLFREQNGGDIPMPWSHMHRV